MRRLYTSCVLFASLAGCSGESTGGAEGGGGSPATSSTSDTASTTGTGSTTDSGSTTTTDTGPRRLVLFYRTEGFVHGAIPVALAALTERAGAEGWEVSQTDDAAFFTEANLADVSVVAFVMTSGDVLDPPEQAAFEQFIGKGGGFVGVHSATDTEYDWPWYGELVGGYFSSHPAIQQAAIRVERPSHASTHHLAAGVPWTRTDEWYSFVASPREDVIVLLSLDETSYEVGASAMGDHPIAWYHGKDGGRAFYTALGHTDESWSEAAFMDHVWGGIEWAGGRDWENLLLSELDGVEPVGTWTRLQAPSEFPFTVDATGMFMDDVTNLNQHVYREGITLDPARPYAMEALFRIAPGSDGLNSFCLDLNLDSAEVDEDRVDSWAINVDLGPQPGTGTMKHMGFLDGGFNQIGETLIDWGQKDTEYHLRAEVNVDAAGATAPGHITATVLREGVEIEKFTVDYASFPYQPAKDSLARVGVNTHGTDWWMRSLRVYYKDGAP